jgi:NDP-sugar pyrophosphorylase family protein
MIDLLNIVIPMAGRGSRFANAGYELPKPLVDVNGRPMIACVVENIRPTCEHRFIFLVLADHARDYALEALLEEIAPGCEVVLVDETTEGAACTVLLARKLIDGPAPLMIANSDQWVGCDIDAYLAAMQDPEVDGLIMTMWADHPKWSYVRTDGSGAVTDVVEKEVVSNDATTGIYNFCRGADFVAAADRMISRDLRVNGEFYVAPVYNTLIQNGAEIRAFNIGAAERGMYGLGTPEDLNVFLASPESRYLT